MTGTAVGLLERKTRRGAGLARPVVGSGFGEYLKRRFVAFAGMSDILRVCQAFAPGTRCASRFDETTESPHMDANNKEKEHSRSVHPRTMS
jgi:hypothetical protein